MVEKMGAGHARSLLLVCQGKHEQDIAQLKCNDNNNNDPDKEWRLSNNLLKP
jgi:hypothetical protein